MKNVGITVLKGQEVKYTPSTGTQFPTSGSKLLPPQTTSGKHSRKKTFEMSFGNIFRSAAKMQALFNDSFRVPLKKLK